jgi:hypothetical protein
MKRLGVKSYNVQPIPTPVHAEDSHDLGGWLAGIFLFFRW